MLDIDSRVEVILKALLWADIIASGILLILSPWFPLFVPWIFPLAWIIFIGLLLFFAIDEESTWKLTIVILISIGGIVYGINNCLAYLLLLLVYLLEAAVGVLLVRAITKTPKQRRTKWTQIR